jgi:hypothetical protein
MTVTHIVKKVLRADRRLFRIELDPNIAHARRHQYHWVLIRHSALPRIFFTINIFFAGVIPGWNYKTGCAMDTIDSSIVIFERRLYAE